MVHSGNIHNILFLLWFLCLVSVLLTRVPSTQQRDVCLREYHGDDSLSNNSHNRSGN